MAGPVSDRRLVDQPASVGMAATGVADSAATGVGASGAGVSALVIAGVSRQAGWGERHPAGGRTHCCGRGVAEARPSTATDESASSPAVPSL
jgi:hypothetical protein